MADPNQAGGDHAKHKSDVKVHGIIEAHIPKNLLDQHIAERKEDEATHIAERTEDRRHEKHKLLLERLGFVAVVIYAGLTAWQACIANRTLALTRDQMIYSQRPWVGTDLRDTPIPEIVDGKNIVWNIDFKNYGNSPALHVKWHTQLILNYDENPDWHEIESEAEHLDLSQGMEYTIFPGQKAPNVGVSPLPAPAGTKDGLRNWKPRVIVIGIVRYDDEFKITHTTTFCTGYLPRSNEPTPGYVTCPVKPIAN